MLLHTCLEDSWAYFDEKKILIGENLNLFGFNRQWSVLFNFSVSSNYSVSSWPRWFKIGTHVHLWPLNIILTSFTSLTSFPLTSLTKIFIFGPILMKFGMYGLQFTLKSKTYADRHFFEVPVGLGGWVGWLSGGWVGYANWHIQTSLPKIFNICPIWIKFGHNVLTTRPY